MKTNHPAYDRSLLSLVSSVLAYYGVDTPHNTLSELDELLAKNYKNVVVMLFDGMGTAILEKHMPPDAFLRKHLKSNISSVFPPTTTAATITMETGLSPIEHGWLGWSLYFDEIGANVSIFPNTLSGTGGESAADYHVARRYIPCKNIYEKISKATNNNVSAYCISPFSSFRSGSVNEISDTVEKLCGEDGRKYIYTYWYQPDYDMHNHGTVHEQVAEDIKQIDAAVETLCGKLQDTLVIITADHGLVDTAWRFIPDYPDVVECLLRMPSIELRAMTFFIKEGMNERFEAAFHQHFGECYKLYTKNQVLDEKLFGNGTPHLRSERFIGDYLAIATGNISIECSPSTNQDVFKAAHAGMTEEEMNVPFIVVECL